jgi:hypothetical protein
VLKRHREHTKRGAHRGGIYGGRRRLGVHARGKGTTTFIGEHKAVGSFLAHQGNVVVVGSRYGRGTAGSGWRRATAVGQWRRAGGAVWPVCRRRVARPWTRRRRAQGLGSAALKPLDAGRPRRAWTATYDGGVDVAGRDVERAVRARSGAKTVWCSPVPTRNSPNFPTKVHKGLITKVVDLLTLYNF